MHSPFVLCEVGRDGGTALQRWQRSDRELGARDVLPLPGAAHLLERLKVHGIPLLR